MIITYHGRGHVKLVTGDITLALGPVSKDSKKRQTKYGADVAMLPLLHPDYNGVDNVTHGAKEPFVIKSAGEYEIAGVFVNGFSTRVTRDGKDYMANSYVFNFDGIRVVYLGQIQEPLKPEQKEVIDEVDVLFVPVGGDGESLNPYDAAKLATGLEPKIVIPIDHNEKTLPVFMKEMGGEGVQAVDKLTIKKKDIADKLGEVVLIEEI